MPDNEAPVEVIQADRDAAGELWMQAVGIDDASQVDPNDGLAAAQLEEIAIAFARHRFAFSAAPADGEGELRPCPFCAATLSEPTLVRGTGQLFRFHPGVVTDKDCILAGKGFGGESLAAWNRRTFATRAENAQVPHLGDREAIAREALKAADAWDAHCIASERTNAAIPAIDGTRAERAVYDERYRASEEARREMHRAACDFAKWASENRPSLTPSPGGEGETWASIAEWCEATFGPCSPERVATRSREEMKELVDETEIAAGWTDKARIEAADVLICLSRVPGIWEAVEEKMAINRARKWRIMGDGTGYHERPGNGPPTP